MELLLDFDSMLSDDTSSFDSLQPHTRLMHELRLLAQPGSPTWALADFLLTNFAHFHTPVRVSTSSIISPTPTFKRRVNIALGAV